MKKDFSNIQKLIKTAREKTNHSQTDLARLLGFKNGQYISNVERGLCSFPLKKAIKLCELLAIDKVDFYLAYTKDENNHVMNFLWGEKTDETRSTIAEYANKQESIDHD